MNETLRRFYEKHLSQIRWRKSGWGDTRCPFHKDRRPSLSISQDHGGWICRPCGLSGTIEQFAKLLGVVAPDIRLEYFYHDRDGEVIYKKVRGPGKTFWVERREGNSWVKGLNEITPVLYRLPEVIGSTLPVTIVEGEKDATRLWWEAESVGIQLIVTTPTFGAAERSWRPHFNEVLKERQVFIIPDNDETGIRHAKQVFRSLWGVAEGVVIVEVPGLGPHQDVSDWLNQGHILANLICLMDSTWQRSFEKGLLRPREMSCQT